MRQGGRQGSERDAAVILRRQLVCLGGFAMHLHCDDDLQMQTQKLRFRLIKDQCINTAR